MNKKSLLATLLFVSCIAVNSYAQQIKVTQPFVCIGNSHNFSIPRFALPPSTNIESYTFFVGPDTITTTENEYTASYAPGTYNAQAKIILSNGTVLNTNTLSFGVTHNPIASFSLTNGTNFCSTDSAVCISNTSTSMGLPIVKTLWVWGDNSAPDTTYASACHQYNQAGTFTVLLRVDDSIGCAAETTFTVTFRNKINPTIDWQGQASCFGSTYLFKNNYNKSIKSYSWNFGDGQTYSATSPFTNEQAKHIDTITHTYSIAGPFTPTLSITDSNGCTIVQSKNYAQQGMLPTNIVISKNIISSTSQFSLLNQQTFCTKDNSAHFRLEDEDALSTQTQYAYFSFLWTFDDPNSMDRNFNTNAKNISHTFMGGGGDYIVKFDMSSNFPNCIFYDTISIVGPQASIEKPQIGVGIQGNQKYQVTGADTVDFVNTSSTNGISNKLQYAWDFGDNFAPQCTAYSVPQMGAILPFTTAQEQYNNSNHFYIVNGTTFSGKMNCRWSLDSLPRHKYTNWDTVCQWYKNGKQFPAFWNLANIQPNTPITTYNYINTSTGIYDPFLLTTGIIATIPSNKSIAPNNSIDFFIPKFDTTIYRNGYDVLPNSSQTFYEYMFHHAIARPYTVRLNVVDSSSTKCVSQSEMTISHGKSDGMDLMVNGKQCAGSNPHGVIFDLRKKQNTFVLINFDSLADRKDATPCSIDGFVGYQGGSTPGGLSFPPFFSQPNFNQIPSMWQDGTGNRVYYHYGLNAPANRPPPADTATGLVTIGVIIGSGCANPPFCTEAEVYSDTVWYHNIIQIHNLDSRFTVNHNNNQYEAPLYSKNESITVYPQTAYQPNIKYDLWQWGDGTVTVDSFLYAKNFNLPQNYTDGHFINGYRRVRYNYTIDNNYLALIDSIEFPNGIPATRLNTDTFGNNYCSQNNPDVYLLKDSALLLLPIQHALVNSSYEIADNPTSPTINSVIHLIVNTNECAQVSRQNITIGIIDSIESITNTSSGLCAGQKVKLKGYARYFRCDNQVTDPQFNPMYSCATGGYYDHPYAALSFDTLDFWRLNQNQTADIKYTYLNPYTNKQDTIYYEKMFWDFGDGSPIVSGLSAEHNYTVSGTYSVLMITRDSVGGWDTCFKEIVVSGKPVALITTPFTHGGEKDGVTLYDCFFDKSTPIYNSSFMPNQIENDSIKTCYWWYGNKQDSVELWQDSTAPQLNHEILLNYTNRGLYKIKLVVVSNAGCSDSTSLSIFLKGPRPAFKVISASEGCAPFKVKLVNQADQFRKFVGQTGTTANGDDDYTETTFFDFGDGSKQFFTQNAKDTIEYTYSAAGEYSIFADGSDSYPGPIGEGLEYCDRVRFPDINAGNPPIVITVRDANTNGIVGKSKVALSASEKYSVSRTPNASYHWTTIGGTITSSNNDSSTIQIAWSTTDGNYKLICHKNTNSCSTSDTLLVAVGNTAGVDEMLINNTVSIYPNPTSTQFTVKFNTLLNTPAHVALFDLLGKKQLEQTIHANTSTEHTFTIQALKPGMYVVEVQIENRKLIQKLIIE